MNTAPQPNPVPETMGAIAFPCGANKEAGRPKTELMRPLNLWNLLKALRQRWLSAATVGVLCAALVVVALWFLLPQPKQMARSLLHVYAVRPHLLFPTSDGYSFEM